MKKIILLSAFCILHSALSFAQNWKVGIPNDPYYVYLKEYKNLKEYVDHEKYPNFKLALALAANDYNNDNTWKQLADANFTELVTGNAMKMSSCVNNSGVMNFTTVKNFINNATAAGHVVYGHTLAWHSQQPKGWLLSLMQDKPAQPIPDADTPVYTDIASKDFCTQQNIGWHGDFDKFGFSVSFSSTDGLKVTTTKTGLNNWDVQYIGLSDIPAVKGKTYKVIMTLKGSSAGSLVAKLGDWNSGPTKTFKFTTQWQDVEMEYSNTVASPFLLIQHGSFIGNLYIKKILIQEKVMGKTITNTDGSTQIILPTPTPLTPQEKHDTLVYAMDKWIKGMMEACAGKVKAWDLVNEAISGGNPDNEGVFALQHSKGYNPNGTWDVGGDAFYWQDYMGDLDYVRQACRLARKYGPSDVTLFINDYNLESDWDNNGKLRSLIKWIERWESDGVTHIDGIGTQMHISYYMNASTQASKKKHIEQMFQMMAETGKLVRVSELDMGIVDTNNNSIPTSKVTEAQHKLMADFYEWIIKKYFEIIPADQQWGICQWCATDSPANSGWRADTPVGLWTLGTFYRKHTYAGFARGLGANPNNPSAIEGVEVDEQTASDANIYSINGQLLSKDFNSLPAGLYIVDGKKVIKK